MRIAAVVASLVLIAQASAQTAFTYQGELMSSGAAASGLHDMRFRLYGADGSGNSVQVGPTLCADNINVADGRFTTTLDFGAQFSGSDARFLEIEVRQDTGLSCGNLGGFTVLSPRQQVTSAPRATAANFATSANGLVRADGTNAVSVNSAGNVGVSTTLPVARLHVAEGDIVAGTSGQEWMFHTRSSFAGDFLQITDADAGAFQFQRGLVVHQNGNVGIGTTLPVGRLDVASGGGSYFRIDAPNGDIRVNGGADGFFGLVNEGAAAGRTEFISTAGVNLSINNSNGNVGIGASPDPSRKLYVNGQIGIPATFRIKSIHGTSFLPDVVGRESGYGYYDTVGMRGYGIGSGNFIAPVELPDGCQVQRIDLTFVDSRAAADFTLTFGRTSTTTGVPSNIASVTTSGQSTAVHVAGVDLGGYGIGNNANAYWLSANLQSFGAEHHQIVAVRITYTVTAPLP